MCMCSNIISFFLVLGNEADSVLPFLLRLTCYSLFLILHSLLFLTPYTWFFGVPADVGLAVHPVVRPWYVRTCHPRVCLLVEGRELTPGGSVVVWVSGWVVVWVFEWLVEWLADWLCKSRGLLVLFNIPSLHFKVSLLARSRLVVGVSIRFPLRRLCTWGRLSPCVWMEHIFMCVVFILHDSLTCAFSSESVSRNANSGWASNKQPRWTEAHSHDPCGSSCFGRHEGPILD